MKLPPRTSTLRETYLEFWKNYFEQTAIQTRILLESVQGGKSLEQLHNQGLAALSQSLDSFMRTPVFLETLKQSIRWMIDIKLMQDQMVQTASQQAGLPMAADVAGVFERVHSAEQTIMAQLARLDERLQAIEKRMNSGPAEKESKRKRATTKYNRDDAPDNSAD